MENPPPRTPCFSSDVNKSVAREWANSPQRAMPSSSWWRRRRRRRRGTPGGSLLLSLSPRMHSTTANDSEDSKSSSKMALKAEAEEATNDSFTSCFPSHTKNSPYSLFSGRSALSAQQWRPMEAASRERGGSPAHSSRRRERGRSGLAGGR